MEPATRRAALIATAVTVPLVLVVGLVLGNASDNPSGRASSTASNAAVLPQITVAAPPSSIAATGPCTKVLEALPPTLTTLNPRRVVSDPSSPFVVGWGNPAVVLRCGVARPASLKPGDSETLFLVNGVAFAKQSSGSSVVYTAVDRAAYVEVTVPSAYAGGPMSPLATAIATALPAVCAVDPAETDPGKLCTHRP